MNKRIASVKKYVNNNRRKVAINSLIGVCFIALAVALLLHYIEVKRTTYEASRACDLLTVQKAGELLGDRVVNVESNTPIIADDLATSKCSYTDANPNTAKMKVVAIAVRSAVRDKSVDRNEKDFAEAKSAQNMVTIKNLGSDAFFDPSLGQLNVFQKQHRRWIILSYGTAESPEASSVEQVRELANIVLK